MRPRLFCGETSFGIALLAATSLSAMSRRMISGNPSRREDAGGLAACGPAERHPSEPGTASVNPAMSAPVSARTYTHNLPASKPGCVADSAAAAMVRP